MEFRLLETRQLTLTDAGILSRKVLSGDKVLPVRQIRLLRARLNDFHESLDFLRSGRGAKSPTSRIRALRALRKSFRKRLKDSEAPIGIKNPDLPTDVAFRLLRYAIAECLDKDQPEKVIHTSAPDEEYKRMLREDLPGLIDLTTEILENAQSQISRVGSAPPRSSDHGKDLTFMELMTTYEEIFDQPAVMSTTASDPASGPLYRFLAEILTSAGLSHTPDGIRTRVRKLHRLRCSGNLNYDYGLDKFLPSQK